MNLADGPARGCEKAASAARTAAVRAVATWLADQANVARVAELADSSAIFLVNPGIVIVGKDLQRLRRPPCCWNGPAPSRC
jgi:hypothetical protein